MRGDKIGIYKQMLIVVVNKKIILKKPFTILIILKRKDNIWY